MEISLKNNPRLKMEVYSRLNTLFMEDKTGLTLIDKRGIQKTSIYTKISNWLLTVEFLNYTMIPSMRLASSDSMRSPQMSGTTTNGGETQCFAASCLMPFSSFWVSEKPNLGSINSYQKNPKKNTKMSK